MYSIGFSFHKKFEKYNGYSTPIRLYDESLKIYFDECSCIAEARKDEMDIKYDLMNLFLKEYDIIINGMKI